MKKISSILALMFALVAITLTQCKKSDKILLKNEPPIANAGPDQLITSPASLINLDGSGSTDPENNITAYEWTKISGPSTFHFTRLDIVKTQVGNLMPGIYQFELKVTDAGGKISKDTVQVTVNEETCGNSDRTPVNARLVSFGMLSEDRGGMVIASAGSKIVFAGAAISGTSRDYGSSRVDIYDINTQIWSIGTLSEKRSHMAVIASGNKIFFAGGRLGDGAFDDLYATVDIYDVSTNQWSVASLSEPRAQVSAAAVGNKVFFAGGEKDWDYNTSRTVDIFDISTNNWTVAHLSTARANISAVTVNNKIYFAGGTAEDRWYTPSDRIDIYDDLTNSWTTSTLSESMGPIIGINVADKIYWAGKCTVEIRDVNTGNISLEHLFKPGNWMIDAGSNAVVKDNKIIFLRHTRGYPGYSNNKFDIYDISTKSWSIGVLPMSIDVASIFSLNNTIYVAGGYSEGVALKEVWKLEF